MSVISGHIDKKNGKMKCGVCGSTMISATVRSPNDDEQWIEIRCKKCNALLFYNGA
jgi:DNA-directed RNA polymerase subunit RPC12/RpoP